MTMNLSRLLGAALVVSSMVLASPVLAANRTLTRGMSGDDVTALQTTLIAKGYLSAAATGTFGPATLAAVKKFQCEKKIACSGSGYGVVGPKTQAALGPAEPISSRELTGKLAGPLWTGALEAGGWIPYWREATGTADVLPHLSQMTEISPFVLTLKSDGTVYDAGGLNEEPWTSFVAAAKAKKVRVIPTVMSGSGDLIHEVLSDAKKRVALEDEIAALVKNGGYDGIDIDFEAKHAATKDYFSTFLKGLAQRLGDKWLYCSVEARMPLVNRYGYNGTVPPDATEFSNDYSALNKYCDRVEIMTYDQGAIDVLLNQSRAAPYVPVADPAWVENVIALAKQSISPQKILVGIATYGYEYSVTPLQQGFRYDRNWAFNPMYATQLAAQLGITPVRNSAGELSFIYKANDSTQAAVSLASIPGSVTTTVASGNTTAPPDAVYSQASIAGGIQPPFNIVWWSDAKAIGDKVALAKKLGVRGVAVFKFDGGQDQGMWSYLPGGALHSSL